MESEEGTALVPSSARALWRTGNVGLTADYPEKRDSASAGELGLHRAEGVQATFTFISYDLTRVPQTSGTQGGPVAETACTVVDATRCNVRSGSAPSNSGLNTHESSGV